MTGSCIIVARIGRGNDQHLLVIRAFQGVGAALPVQGSVALKSADLFTAERSLYCTRYGLWFALGDWLIDNVFCR